MKLYFWSDSRQNIRTESERITSKSSNKWTLMRSAGDWCLSSSACCKITCSLIKNGTMVLLTSAASLIFQLQEQNDVSFLSFFKASVETRCSYVTWESDGGVLAFGASDDRFILPLSYLKHKEGIRHPGLFAVLTELKSLPLKISCVLLMDI